MIARSPAVASQQAFWRPLLLFAAVEVVYVVLTRVVFILFLEGSRLELATTLARLATIGVYWHLFPGLIRSRQPQPGKLANLWPLLAMGVVLLNPLLFGNDAWSTWIDQLVFASTSFVVGPREELAYRAVLQNLLERRLPWPLALVIGSTVFAFYHYGYFAGGPFTLRHFAELFLSGAAFGLIYRFSGSLLAVALLHSLVDAPWSLSPWLASPLPQSWRLLMDAAAVLLLLPWSLRGMRRPA